MNDLTLHYLYDPLCGWCYGASPLLAAACEVTCLDVRLHGGGMMTDANRQPVGAGLRHYVGAAITGEDGGYVGKVLAEHFPKSDDNPNELPDRLIEL